jgi:hypothetical protein
MDYLSVDPFRLPSLPLCGKAALPSCPAIYFLLDGGMVLYVGRSVNLGERWASHHRFDQARREAKDSRISWLEVGNPSLLYELESALISRFKPEWNNQMSANNAPWGYRIENKRLVPDFAQWSSARRAVDVFIGGASLRQVNDAIQGMDSPGSAAAWRNWLINPVLLGHTRYHGANKFEGKLIYNTHTALITEAERHQILQRLEDNRRLGQGQTRRLYAITTSYCFCAACGKRCRMQGASPRRYLRCSDEQCIGWQRPTIRDLVVEAAIQNAIAEAAEAIAREALESGDAVDPRVAAWEAEIKALEPLAHRPGIAAEIESIRREISNAKATQGYQVASREDLKNLVVAVSKFSPEDWALLSTEERRTLYRDLVDRVEVLQGEIIRIRLNT